MKPTNNPNKLREYFQLIAEGEPFRLLFPVGVLIGLAGVLLWPLFVWNLMKTYPGLIHPRIMIEGFLTCFIIGFLGTALPRLMDVPRFSLLSSLGFAAAQIADTLLHATGHGLAGDLLFFFTLLTFVGALAVRAAIFRKDVPPPAFILVAMGLLSALAGTAVLMLAQVVPASFPAWLTALGRLLLNQAYLLLPIMGVGAFLLPRFFGLPNHQNFPESLALPPGWSKRAGFAFSCGAMVMGSFVLEALGILRWAFVLRTAGVLIYFFKEVPVHQAGFGGGSLASALRLSLLAIPTGFILMAIWPERVFSFLHVVFITGFGLITFTVASRVMLGHGGQSSKFRARLWPVLVLTACMVLAMLTRVSADWLPKIRMTHYAYAAVAWALGVGIWAFHILPSVLKRDLEQ